MGETPQQHFLRRAIDLATNNVRNRIGGPFGAVIVRNREVIAEGINRVTDTNDPTAHAEIVAIRGACRTLSSFDLRGCSLFASCEPCPMCLAAIYWAHIDSVYYAATKEDAARAGFDDSFIYHEFALLPEERRLTAKNLLRLEGQEPIETWLASEQKIPY